jgi:replicative DNA helicase
MSFLEKEILGCFLKDNALLQETNLAVYHFKKSHHRALFKTMLEMSRDNKAIDHVTLMTERHDLIIDLGGPAYVLELQSKGNPNNYDTYERELLEQYKERETERVINEWFVADKKDRQQLIDRIETIQDEGTTEEVDTVSLLAELHDEINKPKTDIITGIPSGIETLDQMTGGWQPETNVIVGARPSMGKTAIMLKFMLSAMKNGDVPIIFSIEMPARLLLKRLVSAIGGINSFMARNPQNLSDSMQKKWMDSVGELSNYKFEIHEDSEQTIQFIRSKIRKAIKKYEGKRIVVMIDYLTLIQNHGTFTSDHAKVSDISFRINAIKKDYKIPVITLAQLSRGVESRSDKRPLASDLRDSGSIEQDADIIMLLYRESYYNKEYEKQNELEIDLVKHREGATGRITVDYNRSTGVIKD